ncbi:outer membrane protein assembly factor BamC [uncultured Thiodictyon sp.]|uniref:outer membrane protein assembly factor BamC n=1 Tax=uncultured Thiodictyon sp. TaxID=1846217 RepID=UPI0025D2B4C4|nr:outer membrane protein assembly factor BamC [uncultured Thiodictyon sp.]
MRSSRVLGGPAVLSILSLLVVASLCGCGMLKEAMPDQGLAYQKSRQAEQNLELPPDLKGANFDDAMDVPPIAGGATYSEYADGRAQRRQASPSGAGAILPTVENVELRRSGDSRWLEVQAAPQQVWPRVVAFWREQGILLVDQNPAVGVMKTDWIENRAEVPQGFLTRMFRKVADGLYATSTRDQYSIRMEPGAKGAGTTEVHLTHRGMEEKLETGTLGDSKRTVWQPGKSDQGKEAEMLRRLMLFLGAPEKKAAAALASTAPRTPSTGTPASVGSARLVGEGPGTQLLIPEDFQRGWRITGTALDRAGFAVKDRDMSRGVYYVRYQDMDAGATPKARGWGERLAFWRKADIDRLKEYQIKVEGNDRETRVSVVDPSGARDSASSAGRILALLQEQMK